MNGKGYGMPSSHAQYVSFFSVTLTLFLLSRHRPSPTTSHDLLSFRARLLFCVLVFLSATLVAASRVYLNYHNRKQVLAGWMAGLAFALLWYGFTSWLRNSGRLDAILDMRLVRMLRVRDLVITEDPARTIPSHTYAPGWPSSRKASASYTQL